MNFDILIRQWKGDGATSYAPLDRGPSLRDGKGKSEAEQDTPLGRLLFSRTL